MGTAAAYTFAHLTIGFDLRFGMWKLKMNEQLRSLDSILQGTRLGALFVVDFFKPVLFTKN
jgi:hypothetical protein